MRGGVEQGGGEGEGERGNVDEREADSCSVE